MECYEQAFINPITSPPIAGGNQLLHYTDEECVTNLSYPPGLEYLSGIDQLLVYHQVELLEVLVGFESNNKYIVKNKLGETVYYATEDTNCLMRNFFGPNRSFDMKIIDTSGNEVIRLNRPLRCTRFCFPSCLQTMEVSSPPGTVIAHIEQDWSILHHKLNVKNAVGDVLLRIYAPVFECSCGGGIEHQVLSADGQEKVGKIVKQWAGVVQECLTDATNFEIHFTKELDVNLKATLIGACILIDFMFLEKSAKAIRNHCCGCSNMANP